MKCNVTQFPFPAGGNLKSFRELSLDEENKRHCIGETSPVANVEALDFDALTKAVYQPLWARTGKLPCSVDALYLHCRDTLYAVEFKTGVPENWNLIRKVYDTVMCLTEHGQRGFNYAWARNHLIYVVVCSDGGVVNSIKQRKVQKRPWTCRGKPAVCDRFRNLAALEGVIVSEIRVLIPEDFENLALKLGWVR